MHIYVHKYPRIVFYLFVRLFLCWFVCLCMRYESKRMKRNDAIWNECVAALWRKQSGSGTYTFWMAGKNCILCCMSMYWFFLINRTIVCIDGLSLCVPFDEWLSFFSVGCFKACYCFRHDKLKPSQRRWFSIFVSSHFFLLLLSQSKTRRHLFRWKKTTTE